MSLHPKDGVFQQCHQFRPFDDGLDEEIINHVNKIDDKKALSGDEDDNNKETVGKLHEFGDYATYFHSKRLKQQNKMKSM